MLRILRFFLGSAELVEERKIGTDDMTFMPPRVSGGTFRAQSIAQMFRGFIPARNIDVDDVRG